MSFRSLFKKTLFRAIALGWAFLVLGLVGSLTTWVAIKREVSGRVVEVPDLYGLEMEAASDVVDGLGLRLIVEDQTIYSNVVNRGGVLFQIPKPGKKIKAGRTVEITVSAGPETKRVPALVGEPLNFAYILAGQADTEINRISRIHTNNAAKGRIVAQNPKPGNELGIQHGISVLVSDGDPTTWYVTPRLEGKSYHDVKKFLDREGFRVVTKYKRDPDAPTQVVIRQNPQPGYPLQDGQTITLEVNRD